MKVIIIIKVSLLYSPLMSLRLIANYSCLKFSSSPLLLTIHFWPLCKHPMVLNWLTTDSLNLLSLCSAALNAVFVVPLKWKSFLSLFECRLVSSIPLSLLMIILLIIHDTNGKNPFDSWILNNDCDVDPIPMLFTLYNVCDFKIKLLMDELRAERSLRVGIQFTNGSYLS